MDKIDIERLRRAVKSDEKYLKFKRAVDKNPNLHLPFEELHDELGRMQRTRQVRSLSRSDKNFTQTVIDAMLQDQAYRSRCTEILASCISITGAFQETLVNLRDYLILEYGTRMGSKGRVTKEERRNFMENVLRPFFRYIHKVEQLKEHARLIIEDIDKAGYTYRNLVESIKLLGKPESI
jgi:hypothetical protein